jgi:hypothetical protein
MLANQRRGKVDGAMDNLYERKDGTTRGNARGARGGVERVRSREANPREGEVTYFKVIYITGTLKPWIVINTVSGATVRGPYADKNDARLAAAWLQAKAENRGK